ncbi:MAG: SagB/ThcOx family dehydrogenase, partial [Acidobacteria bacterium ACB2]|nr:SagB/ThcOx family dehydrogenase [Acidobacteria bacterium ACB2]
PPPGPRPFEPFSSLARRRRSAVGFDGATPYPLAAFAATLDLLLSRPGVPPWDALPWEPLVHPVLLVHRVEGIEPGLYALPRSPEGEALLRAGLSRSFEWRPVGSVPAHLPLRLLVPGDFRERARTVSCHQPIASDGAFAVAMLAPLPAVVRERGARWYPRLFHEAGALGQVLYLEAEAWGLRGTGIGCFFDDAVHDLLGVADGALQSLYHFTAGAPLDDPRVSTSPPYAHLTGRL